jgi:hypothetical protein
VPALPDVAKTIRMSWKHTYSLNSDVVSRFYISYSGSAPTTGQLSTLNTTAISGFATYAKPMMHADVELIQLESTDLSTPSSAQVITAASETGSRAGNVLAADAAMVTAYEINRRYRGGHPRGYWPWGVEGDLTNAQQWGSSMLSASLAAIEGLVGTVTGAPWSGAGTLQMSNVSYYEGFTVVTNPISGRARNVPTVRATPVIDQVLSFVCREQVGSQRRRLNT